MLSEERQRTILEILSRDGRVLVVDLAKHFHTSVVTIRKDLEILHMKGRIHRTHGGAVGPRERSRRFPITRKREVASRGKTADRCGGPGLTFNNDTSSYLRESRRSAVNRSHCLRTRWLAAAEYFEGAAVLSRLRSLRENTRGLRGIAAPL